MAQWRNAGATHVKNGVLMKSIVVCFQVSTQEDIWQAEHRCANLLFQRRMFILQGPSLAHEIVLFTKSWQHVIIPNIGQILISKTYGALICFLP